MKKNGKVTQKDVAAHLGLNQTTISRILACTPRFTYSEDTRARVFEAARVLGYLHPAVVKTEKRGSPRRALPAVVRVRILLHDGKLYSTYTAELVDINRCGALLKGLTGKKRALPVDPFSIEIDITSPEVGDVRAQARPIRFSHENGKLGLGVAFTHVTDDQSARIEEYVNAATRREEHGRS